MSDDAYWKERLRDASRGVDAGPDRAQPSRGTERESIPDTAGAAKYTPVNPADDKRASGPASIGTHVHLDARPDHVRRAEDAAWRENEKQERARI
jgi:hypothetical protein